jgi:hypothetical protein
MTGKRILRILASPLLFCLFVGGCSISLLILNTEAEFRIGISEVFLALLIGVGSGWGVYLVEKHRYDVVRGNLRKQHLYKTTSLWKYIYILYLFLIVLVNKKGLVAYQAAYVIALSSSVYLLVLAFILYRIRRNKQAELE